LGVLQRELILSVRKITFERKKKIVWPRKDHFPTLGCPRYQGKRSPLFSPRVLKRPKKMQGERRNVFPKKTFFRKKEKRE